MDQSTISSDSSFTGTFTTTDRSSSLTAATPSQSKQQSKQQSQVSGPQHSSDEYDYYSDNKSQKEPREADENIETSNLISEGLKIIEDDAMEMGQASSSSAMMDAIPEATSEEGAASSLSARNEEKTRDSPPTLHYKKQQDEESAWVAPEQEEEKEQSLTSYLPPDDRSQSSNSWFMPGYTFRDQAPRARNVDLYYKQEPPVEEPRQQKHSTTHTTALPNNKRNVAISFTSWVPTPYLVKPTKPNPEPARMSHREPLEEEDPWVVPRSTIIPHQPSIQLGSVDSSSEEEEVEVLEEEQVEMASEAEREEDVSTFPDEEFSEMDYNDDESSASEDCIDDESTLPPEPEEISNRSLPANIPPPLLPPEVLEEALINENSTHNKVTWSATQYGNWDDSNNSSSSSSADDSSAHYDRSLSWDGFSSSSSEKGGKKKSSKKGDKKQQNPQTPVRRGKRTSANKKAEVPRDFSFLDQSDKHTSEISFTTRSRMSSDPGNSDHPRSVAPYDPSSSSSSSSKPSSSSSSSSSSKSAFEDEYTKDSDDDEGGWDWDPSFRTLILLVLINIIVLAGIVTGIVLWVQGNKDDESNNVAITTVPPGTGAVEQAQANDNIFKTTQSTTPAGL